MAKYITYTEVITSNDIHSFKDRLNEIIKQGIVRDIVFTNTKYLDKYEVEQWHYEAIVIMDG